MKTQHTMQILKYELYLHLHKYKAIITMFLPHLSSDCNHNYQSIGFLCLKDISDEKGPQGVKKKGGDRELDTVNESSHWALQDFSQNTPLEVKKPGFKS